MSAKSKNSGPSLEDLFSNEGSSIDAIKDSKERGDKPASKSSTGPFYKLPEGQTDIRILPPINNSDPFFYATGYHYLNGTSIYCRRWNEEDPTCPVCAHASKLWNKFKETGEERIKKEATSLFAKQLYIYNAIVRDDEEGDKVVVLQTGKGVKDNITDLVLDPNIGDISHVLKGRDISITRSGSGITTKYSVIHRDRSLLAEVEGDTNATAKLIKSIMESRKNLSSLIEYPSVEEALKVVAEYEESVAAGEKSEKSSSSVRNGGIKSSLDEDDDEEKIIEDDDDDTIDDLEKQLAQYSKKKK